MTIGSTRIGSRGGGSALPAITFVGDDDRINEMRLGMSYYAGDLVGANFCAAIEHKPTVQISAQPPNNN